jgi:hypothetical protein
VFGGRREEIGWLLSVRNGRMGWEASWQELLEIWSGKSGG